MRMRPRMIALVGVDGSGKTTAARRLAQELNAAGARARYFENGGGRPLIDPLARRLGRPDGRQLLGWRGYLAVEASIRWAALARAVALSTLTRRVAVLDRYAYCQYALIRARGDGCSPPPTADIPGHISSAGETGSPGRKIATSEKTTPDANTAASGKTPPDEKTVTDEKTAPPGETAPDEKSAASGKTVPDGKTAPNGETVPNAQNAGGRTERLVRLLYGVFPRPDVTIYLAVEAGEAARRVEARGRDREEPGYL